MNNNKITKKQSKLENFELGYEHTDDNRTIIINGEEARRMKKPDRKTATRTRN